MRRLCLIAWILLMLSASAVVEGRASADEHEPVPDETITIALGGDVSLGREVNLVAARQGPGAPLRPVHELRSADLAIVNLESVVAGGGERNPHLTKPLPHYFRGRPETLAVLTEAGIDVVLTANSHAADYGTDALHEQHALLQETGILGPGFGANRASACAPAYVAVRELVVAVLAVDTVEPAVAAGHDLPGTCHLPLDEDAITAVHGPLLREARRQADVVLVGIHWGDDFESEPSAAKRDIGRLLIELGADGILGTQAHVTQGVEVHEGRPIIHDAGNLLMHFDQPHDGAVFVLTVSAAGIERVEHVPLVAEQGWTRRPTSGEAAESATTFADRSSELGTTVSADGSIEFSVPPRPSPSRQPATSERRTGRAPEPLRVAPAECVVSTVPPGARIEPQMVGPLTLLGVQASYEERMLLDFVRVESFWRVDEPSDPHLLLSGRGAGASAELSWTETQEPCDWAWPTSRWTPGTIYRDVMFLRPSDAALSPLGVLQSATGMGSPIAVSLAVVDSEEVVAETPTLVEIPIGPTPWAFAPLAPVLLLLTTVGARWYLGRRRRRVADAFSVPTGGSED
jgi:hypothetical protein